MTAHIPPGIVHHTVPNGLMGFVKEAQHMAGKSEGRTAMILEKVALGAVVFTGVVSAIHVVKELLRDKPERGHHKGR